MNDLAWPVDASIRIHREVDWASPWRTTQGGIIASAGTIESSVGQIIAQGRRDQVANLTVEGNLDDASVIGQKLSDLALVRGPGGDRCSGNRLARIDRSHPYQHTVGINLGLKRQVADQEGATV